MAYAPPFLDALRRLGYDFFTGVPCSSLGGVFKLIEQEPVDRYVPAVREDAALGFAAGAYLGGRRCAVLMQNSGLGVSVNTLGQLHNHYEIPCLLVISWRGYTGKDAPEHLVSSELLPGLLQVLKIPSEVLDPSRMGQQLQDLTDRMAATRKPVALLVPPGVFE
jgi:sulfopyruvate decarboxylase alpha subunit